MAGKYLCLLVHYVWSTAHRELRLSPDLSDRLYGYIGGVVNNKHGKLICSGGIEDHLHLLVSMPSIVDIAEMVNAMKANSSRWVHETFADQKDFAWQKGYGAFSVSKSGEQGVINYIQGQREHHRARDFKQELLALLRKHEIEYDERYLWD